MAMLLFLSSALGVLGALASDELWLCLLVIPIILLSIALIYFVRFGYSLSAVTAATFEMALETKQARIRSETEQVSS